ncbi:MAG: RraA family protein [Acidobacteria bacterium]|nr:RraA family protein [Acidobacteriota bacterium]
MFSIAQRCCPLGFALLLTAAQASAQLAGFGPDQLRKYTPLNPYERLADGRPAIPEYWLERLREASTTLAQEVLAEHGYPNQFEGGWTNHEAGKKLVGRAFTAQFLPDRPDVMEIAEADSKARGEDAHPTKRVIDLLSPGDVLVADIMGRVEKGQFGGDNLILGLFLQTGRGFVINGSFRDLDGVAEHGMPVFVRGYHPGVREDAMLSGVNTPIRIGRVTVMPGDAVLGDRTGVVFIPPHLVEAVARAAFERRQ